MERQAAYQAIAHKTADRQEAVGAFGEKRPQVFSNRE